MHEEKYSVTIGERGRQESHARAPVPWISKDPSKCAAGMRVKLSSALSAPALSLSPLALVISGGPPDNWSAIGLTGL